MMSRSFSTLTRALVIATAVSVGALAASAQGFDAKKFFDRLQAEGSSVPAGFDARKFFDKLQAEGSSNKLDAKTFFEKLAAEGASMPKGFDAKKFFEKLQAEGSSSMMPPMVDMKK
jgi:uncharacterized glyoxalase superfamily protein PhnB